MRKGLLDVAWMIQERRLYSYIRLKSLTKEEGRWLDQRGQFKPFKTKAKVNKTKQTKAGKLSITVPSSLLNNGLFYPLAFFHWPQMPV